VVVKTQVGIIGAGPAGMLLSHLLDQAGIDSVVLERQSREHVVGRIRAGVLEWGTVEILRSAGLGERLDAEGDVHDLIMIARNGEDVLNVPTVSADGRKMMAYGQTAIQEDLFNAGDARGAQVVFEVSDVVPNDVTSARPWISYTADGMSERLDCDFIAGCDGFHGVSRQAIPAQTRSEYEKVYPFGWLGILSETPPLPSLLYATHQRGFALCSMRTPMLSRYYVQCPLEDSVDDWSDDRFWTELFARLPATVSGTIATGPSVEKSIAPLRSFVSEPMRYGNLFLAGDAAHIVPPTGAKGLNLAASDVFYLARGLVDHFNSGNDDYLETYSETALRRVWSSVRFSWWMTQLLHRFPSRSSFEQRIQDDDLAYLWASANARSTLTEQYVGLRLEE